MYLNKKEEEFWKDNYIILINRNIKKIVLKLRVNKKKIKILTSKEVKQIVDACHTK